MLHLSQGGAILGASARCTVGGCRFHRPVFLSARRLRLGATGGEPGRFGWGTP